MPSGVVVLGSVQSSSEGEGLESHSSLGFQDSHKIAWGYKSDY